MQTNLVASRLMRRALLLNPWSTSRLLVFTLSDGNYTASESSESNAAAMTIAGRGFGKTYLELAVSASGTFDCAVGIRRDDEAIGSAVNVGMTCVLRANGTTFVGSSGASAGTPTTFSTGNRLMLAIDASARKTWVGNNGTWMNSGNPAAGTGAMFSGYAAGVWHPYIWADNNAAGSHVITLYNGQVGAAFSYSAPSGFEAGLKY